MTREEMYTELNTLKYRIAELEAQMNEPEWVPFVGEIVEVSDNDLDEKWTARRFASYSGNAEYRYRSDNGEYWKHCRPLSDPNVIQLRPHRPGDPMPCDDNTRVIYRLRNGDYTTEWAFNLDWGVQDYPATEIDAWAPVRCKR